MSNPYVGNYISQSPEPHVILNLNPDNTFYFGLGSTGVSGTYSVNGNTITITPYNSPNGQAVQFVASGNNLILTDLKGQKIVFVKQ